MSFIRYEILNFHSDISKIKDTCDVTHSLLQYFPTFRRILILSFSGSSCPIHSHTFQFSDVSNHFKGASLWEDIGIPSLTEFYANYFHKVPVILNYNLQSESHNSTDFLPQSRDSSWYISRPILAPPPLWLQKHTDLRAHEFAQSFYLWQQPRFAKITCAWSRIICGINSAIKEAEFFFISCQSLSYSLKCNSLVATKFAKPSEREPKSCSSPRPYESGPRPHILITKQQFYYCSPIFYFISQCSSFFQFFPKLCTQISFPP